DPTLTYTNSAVLLAASFTCALSRASGETVGNYATTPRPRSADLNYSLSLAPASFEITAKAVTITPDAGQSKIYGQLDPTLTYTNSEGLLAASFGGSLSRATGESVGNYAISLGTLSAGNNYSLSLAPASFEITAKGVTITPSSGQSKIFGSADPTLTYTNSEGLLAASLDRTITRLNASHVGNY